MVEQQVPFPSPVATGSIMVVGDVARREQHLMTRTASTARRPFGSLARAGRLLAGAASVLAAILATAGQVRAQNNTGYVYVETNEGGVAGRNAIRAFHRDARGLLTELPGSPFLTRGTGVHPTADLTLANLGPFDSDQCMIFDADRDRIFAVNGGSDTIAVFDVASNGRLTHVKGSPFPSFGANPASVGLSNSNVLVVANKDYDLGRPGFNPATRQGSYTSFRVNASGQLSQFPLSAIPAGPVGGVGPHHPTPTQALISKDGRLAFDANFFGLEVKSFRILPGGQLQPSSFLTPPGPPLSLAGTNMLGLPVPLGLQVHPTQPVLYVGFVLDKSFGVYVFGQQGQMGFFKAVSGVGSGPCWFVTNDAGTRLYISNNFDNSVSVYDITNALNPVKLQQITLAQGPSNAAPFQLALDKQNRFLHVVTQAATPMQDPALANGLNVLRVAPDGTLTVVEFIALPSRDGSRPQGVVAK
jgi:DNA-binding beta-propeller fold protein YncE